MGFSLKDLDILLWKQLTFTDPQDSIPLVASNPGPPNMIMVLYTVLFSCTTYSNRFTFESPAGNMLMITRIGANLSTEQLIFRLESAVNDVIYFSSESDGIVDICFGYQFQNVPAEL